jgi:hypothetical protein
MRQWWNDILGKEKRRVRTKTAAVTLRPTRDRLHLGLKPCRSGEKTTARPRAIRGAVQSSQSNKTSLYYCKTLTLFNGFLWTVSPKSCYFNDTGKDLLTPWLYNFWRTQDIWYLRGILNHLSTWQSSLDKLSARRKESTCRGRHNTEQRGWTPIPWVGLELMIPASEWSNPRVHWPIRPRKKCCTRIWKQQELTKRTVHVYRKREQRHFWQKKSARKGLWQEPEFCLLVIQRET